VHRRVRRGEGGGVSAKAKVTEAELNLGYATIRSRSAGSRPLAAAAGRLHQFDSDSARLTYVAAIDPSG